jgi:polar amino acid transport system substrate-binding protein
MSMPSRRLAAILGSLSLLLVACSGNGGATTAPSVAAPTTVATTAATAAPPTEAPPIAGGLLDKVMKAGKLVVSTDPNYAPQSFLKPDGTYEGFDIDVADAIAEGLGVEVQFETPEWEAITAGSWSGRWDISVGSMTITEDRKGVLDFSVPYYYTPAQMASNDDAIQAVDDFSGTTVCAGESTTYVDWLEGSLTLVDAPPVSDPPSDVTVTTLPTDANCAEAWQAGRDEFQGWISSSTTVQAAIDGGIEMHTVGDPVFYEPLAVAIDKSGPPHDQLLAALNEIIQGMHADGTLTAMSEQWYDGQDLTTVESTQ